MPEDTRSVISCIPLSRCNRADVTTCSTPLYLYFVAWPSLYVLCLCPGCDTSCISILLFFFLSFNSLALSCSSQYNRGRRTWRSPLRLQWGWTESIGSSSGCQRRDLVLASSVQLSFARKFSSLCREPFFTDAFWRKGFSKVCLLLILSELLCLHAALYSFARDGSLRTTTFPVDFWERPLKLCLRSCVCYV